MGAGRGAWSWRVGGWGVQRRTSGRTDDAPATEAAVRVAWPPPTTHTHTRAGRAPRTKEKFHKKFHKNKYIKKTEKKPRRLRVCGHVSPALGRRKIFKKYWRRRRRRGRRRGNAIDFDRVWSRY